MRDNKEAWEISKLHGQYIKDMTTQKPRENSKKPFKQTKMGKRIPFSARTKRHLVLPVPLRKPGKVKHLPLDSFNEEELRTIRERYNKREEHRKQVGRSQEEETKWWRSVYPSLEVC